MNPCKDLIIRQAKSEDAEAIRLIIREAFTKYKKDSGVKGKIEALEENIEDIKRDIATKEVLIAFKGNVPAGTIRIQMFPDKTAFISRFGVRQCFLGQGIGKALMNTANERLKSEKVKQVSLFTASKNKSLMGFYSCAGFLVHSESNDRGYVRALMVKEL